MTYKIGEATPTPEAKRLGRYYSPAFMLNPKSENRTVGIFRIVIPSRASWKVKPALDAVWRKIKQDDLVFRAMKCGAT